MALSAEGIQADVLSKAGKQSPALSPSPVAPAPPATNVQAGTATIRQSASVAATVRKDLVGNATAQTDPYTPDQIRAAMAIGADGGADRLANACEAATRRGVLGPRSPKSRRPVGLERAREQVCIARSC